MTEVPKNKKVNRLHYLYTIGILIALVIYLMTYNFGNNQNLLSYLSFALTVASLLLSLLAIVYAFYSNSSFTDTISSLNKSSNEIAVGSKNLEDISKDLADKLEKLPLLIKAIEDKVDLTNAYLADHYEKNNQNSVDSQDDVLTEKALDSYFKFSSTIGVYALYAVHLSKKFNKPFTLKVLNEISEIITIDYTLGFLTSLNCFSLFGRTDFSELWTITWVHPLVEAKIKDQVYIRAEQEKTTQKITHLYSQIENIEKYFGEKQ